MPQATYRVELEDGRVFDVEVEGDQPPSEAELLAHLGVQAQPPASQEALAAIPKPMASHGAPRPSLMQSIGEGEMNLAAANRDIPAAAAEAAGGVKAGLLSTAVRGGDVIRRTLGMERIKDDPQVQAAITPPQTALGNIGFYGEQAYEFGKPLRMVSGAMRGRPLLSRVGADAAASAAVAGTQSGGDVSETATAGALGAFIPAVGGGVRAAQRAASGARDGGIGGAVAGAIRTAAPQDAKPMLIQALKPRAVSRQFAQSLDTALPELKVTEEALGRPIGGVDDLLEATTLAKRRVYSQLNGLRANAQGFEVDLSPVADAMQRNIPKKLRLEHPDAAVRLQQSAEVYRRPFALDDAEQLLKETNAEMEAFYNKYPQAQRKALTADPEWMRLNAQAKALRAAIDGGLDRAVQGQGESARELRRRYGALLDIESEAHRRANVSKRQQPESLSEQLSSARAAGDIARGAWRIARGDISGAADVVSGVAMRDTAKYLKEQQTTDALIRRAFHGFSGAPSPVDIPPRRPTAGLLGPGPVITPPPADRSFVRGVPAIPSHTTTRRALPPAQATPKPGTPKQPQRVFHMGGDIQPDASRVGGVKAAPINYAVDPTVKVKAGGFRVAQYSGDPTAVKAEVAKPEVRDMLQRMLDDLDTFAPERGRIIRDPQDTNSGIYSPGTAGSAVGDDVRVISEQNVSNRAVRTAVKDLLDGKTPTNRLHTAALDAAVGYLEKRPGYRGPVVPESWGSGAKSGDAEFEAFERSIDGFFDE